MIRTEAQFQDYVQNTLLAGIGVTDAEIAQLASLYPSDLTQGSPFDTGVTDALSPQFKRLASFQGDLIFHAPRRWLLQNRSGKQTAFAFCECTSDVIATNTNYNGWDSEQEIQNPPHPWFYACHRLVECIRWGRTGKLPRPLCDDA